MKTARCDSVSNKSTFLRVAVLHIVSLLGGVISCRGMIFGELNPFPMALCAGVLKEYSPSVAIGGIFGTLYLGQGYSLRYIGALVVIVLAKWIFEEIYRPITPHAISGGVAFVSSAFFGILTYLASSFKMDIFLSFMGESVFCSVGAYFISQTISLATVKKKAGRFSAEELTAILFSIAMLLCVFNVYKIGGFTPSSIACTVILLCGARFGAVGTGTLAGIILGFFMGAVSGNLSLYIGAYSLGGLAGGLLCSGGSILTAMSFLFCNLLMQITTSSATTYGVLEVIIGCAIFLTLPQKVYKHAGAFFSPAPTLAKMDGLRKNLVMRLQFASRALTDVSATVDEVSSRLMQIDTPNLTDVLHSVEKDCCLKCGLRLYCYETAKEDTYNALMQMTKTVRRKGEVSEELFPERWGERCCHPVDVAQSLTRHFNAYLGRVEANRRIGEIRSVVSDQMDGLSDMLYDMSSDFDKGEFYDTELASRIDTVLLGLGLCATDVACREDKSGRMSVEIRANPTSARPLNKQEICNEISKVCMRQFSLPCISNSSGAMLINLTEKACYRVEYGVAQLNYKDSKLCGDSFSVFDDGRGKTVFALSDGMGSGGRAAVDSAMATGLMQKLIGAGFGPDSALKILNSAMCIKSTDESMATLDMATVDLFSGEVIFYKAGASESIVRHGVKIGRAVCTSFPAGILRDVFFEKTSVTLKDNDVFVMLSDGVCDTAFIDHKLREFSGNAQEFADEIAEAARRRRDDGHQDDITVIVATVKRQQI